MNIVDTFVVYDNIEFTKKGWIHRNRYLQNGNGRFFSIPLKKDSDYLDIAKRRVADCFEVDKQKQIRKLESAYRNAPFYEQGIALFESCLSADAPTLFDFIYQSILNVKATLSIDTRLVISSSLNIDAHLKGQDKVIAICQSLEATDYVNPIGGTALYTKEAFSEAGITLHFQHVKTYQYRQFEYSFLPNLSIIDTVMFNGVDGTRLFLTGMDLL